MSYQLYHSSINNFCITTSQHYYNPYPRMEDLNQQHFYSLKLIIGHRFIEKSKFVQKFAQLVREYDAGAQEAGQKRAKLKYYFIVEKNQDYFQQTLNYKSQEIDYHKCVVSKRCTKYHKFSIDEIYERIVKCGGQKGKYCEKCQKKDDPFLLTEILPDYMSILFYKSSLGQQITVQKIVKKIDDSAEKERLKRSKVFYKHYNEVSSNLTEFHYYNFSESFQQIVAPKSMKQQWRKPHLQLKNVYQRVKNRFDDTEINLMVSGHQRAFQAIENLKNTSVNIVSTMTGKRLRSGIWHYDCKHTNNPYFFDLEAVITSLFQHHSKNYKNLLKISDLKKAVRCIYCKSQFTKQNILTKAIFFEQIYEVLSDSQFHIGKIFYKNKHPITDHQWTVINIPHKITKRAKNVYGINICQNNLKAKCKQIKIKAVKFWNLQNYLQSKTQIQKIIQKFLLRKELFFEKTIDYSKIFYPIRCKSCATFDFTDVWQSLIRISLFTDEHYPRDKPVEICAACHREVEEEEEDFVKSIYIDQQVFTLMQYNLLHIRFQSKFLRWLPDITKIQFKNSVEANPIQFVIMYLNVHDRVITSPNDRIIIGDNKVIVGPNDELITGKEGQIRQNKTISYYQKDFEVTRKQCFQTECFILQSCLLLPNSFNHIIYLDKDKLKQHKSLNIFKCPLCKQEQSFSIFDLCYDDYLSKNIHKSFKKWQSIQKKFYMVAEEQVRVNNLRFDNMISTFGRWYQKIPSVNEVRQREMMRDAEAWGSNARSAGGLAAFDNKRVDEYVR